MVLVLSFSSIYSVFAQSDDKNTAEDKDIEKFLALDNTMTPTITTTLTGLSLTGASFLVNLSRSIGEDSDAVHVRLARKFFIKAFFMFLICTIVLFVFDFLEILDQDHVVVYVILDVIMAYMIFGFGAIYLIKAASQLYATYGR